MHKEWKEELEKLQLSRAQKQAIKRKVQDKKMKSSHPYIRVVLPAFIALALFAVWLTVGGDFFEQSSPQTGAPINESAEFTIEMLLWTLFTQALVGIAFGLIINVSKIRRLQRYRFWQFVASLWKPSRIVIPIVLLVAGMGMIVWISLYMPNASRILSWIILLGMLIDVMLLQLFLTRHNKRSCCPNCGEPIQMKQFFSIHSTTCPHCQQRIYYSRKDNIRTFITYYAGFAIGMLLMPMLDINFWQLLFYYIPLVIFVFVCIFPYTTYFEKQDDEDLPPPLW